MVFVPQARVIVLSPFVRTLVQMGVRVDPLLRRAGLPVLGESDEHALVPSSSMFGFFKKAARVAGAEGFGLQAGSQSQPQDLGWYGRLLLQSHTGAELLTRATWLIRALHSGHLIWAEPCGDQVRICTTFVDSLREGRREAEHFVLLATVNTIRLFAGQNWRPVEVELQAPVDRALRQYEVLSEARILPCKSRTSLLVPYELLCRPIPPDCRTRRACPPDLQARFVQTAPAIGFLNSVRQMVRARLPNAAPLIEETAEAAGVSVRTLQRKLAEDALSYSRLLDQVRFERARELLADRRVHTIDVAFELGYTDQSNFSRAFRRWSGISPGFYRRVLLQDIETSCGAAAIPPIPKTSGAAP